MSELELATEAEIQSFQPDHTPPFDDLVARRAVTRRNGPWGNAAALGGVAASVVGVVIASSLLAAGPTSPAPSAVTARPSPTASTAAPSTEPAVSEYHYSLSYADSGAYDASQGEALDLCLALPGTRDGVVPFRGSPIHTVVVGTSEVETFEECVGDIDNVEMIRVFRLSETP